MLPLALAFSTISVARSGVALSGCQVRTTGGIQVGGGRRAVQAGRGVSGQECGWVSVRFKVSHAPLVRPGLGTISTATLCCLTALQNVSGSNSGTFQ